MSLSNRNTVRGGVINPFPTKLHSILSQDEISHIISWQPHGRSFLLHQPEDFLKTVMPLHFGQTKLTSFRRQLNLYGFKRVSSGIDKGAYYHSLFLRGKPELCSQMFRTAIKNRIKTKEKDPDFYAMSSMEESSPIPREIIYRSVSPISSDDEHDEVEPSSKTLDSEFEGYKFQTLQPSVCSSLKKKYDRRFSSLSLTSFTPCNKNLSDKFTSLEEQVFSVQERRYNRSLSSFGMEPFQGNNSMSID